MLEQLINSKWDDVAQFINTNVSDPIKASFLASIVGICRRNTSEIPKWRNEFDPEMLPVRFEHRILDWFNFENTIKQDKRWILNMREFSHFTDELEIETIPNFSFYILRIPEILAAEITTRGYEVTMQKDSDLYDIIIAHTRDAIITSSSASATASSFAVEEAMTIISEETGYDQIPEHKKEVLYNMAYASIYDRINHVQSEIDFLQDNVNEVQPNELEEYYDNLQHQIAKLQELNRRITVLRAY